MSVASYLLSISKLYSYFSKIPNTFSNEMLSGVSKCLHFTDSWLHLEQVFETRIRTEGIESMLTLGKYRLTNPRRLVRGVSVLTLALGLSVLGITGSQAGSQPGAALEFVTVQPGDSLWELAESYGSSQDPRDWIARVVQLNALESIELTPGQQIALP